MMNERLDFDDPEQKKIMTWIDVSRIMELKTSVLAIFGQFHFVGCSCLARSIVSELDDQKRHSPEVAYSIQAEYLCCSRHDME